MAETQTPDLAEKQQAYKEGLKGFIGASAQPQSFFEHPATALIPILGPIFASVGDVSRTNRINQTIQQASFFNTAVQSGDLTVDHPAAQGIPKPILDAGIIEAGKIRNTYGYRARKEMEADFATGAYPDLQTYIRAKPELAAAAGLPEAARVGIAAAGNEATLSTFSKATGQPLPRGVQGVGQKGLSTPSTPSLEQPLTLPEITYQEGTDPIIQAGVNQVHADYATGKLKDKDLLGALEAIPGADRAQATAFASSLIGIKDEQMTTRQAQGTQGRIAPLGQFDVNAPAPVSKYTFGRGQGGEMTMSMEVMPLQDRAAAYLLHHTLQNPQNFNVALRDLARKQVTLDPKMIESIQQRAVNPSLLKYYQEGLQRTGNPQQAGAYAVSQVARDFNIDPAQTAKMLEIIKDPQVVEQLMSQARQEGQQQAEIGPSGDVLRQKKMETAVEERTREANINPQQQMAEATSINQAISIVSELKRMYHATAPEQRSAILANLKGMMNRIGAPFGLAENVRDYRSLRETYLSKGGETLQPGTRFTPLDFQNLLNTLPDTNRTGPAADALFDRALTRLREHYAYTQRIYKARRIDLPDLQSQEATPGASQESLDALIKKHKGGKP